jgi:hypothetical protein
LAKKARKYPRKLRQKLEQVAAKRDEREKNTDRAFNTLYHEFVPDGSVRMMHSIIDEQHGRITSVLQMYPRLLPEYIRIRPPWLSDDEGPAST